ncbi:MAG: hypothetical protein WC517_03520 [Patescibacteria group bacterium]
MQFDWKKIGVMALFVLAVFFFGFFIYWFFWRPLFGPTTVSEVATTTGAVLPGAGAAGSRATTTGPGGLPIAGGTADTDTPTAVTAPIAAITKAANVLVDVPAYYSSMTASGKIVYYNSQDGKFYSVDANGNITALSDQTFFNVSNAVFDHAGGKAVIQYPDGSNIIYDFAAKKQITLPKHWQDFGFSATDQNIAFKNIGLDPANRFLVTAKYDGTNVKIIEEIGENADKVRTNWSPDNQVVATYNVGKDASRSEIFFIGQNNENFKSLTVEGRDFRGLWSPDSGRMLYSVYNSANDYKPQLWISDASGDNIGNNRQKIDLNAWADSCTFAGNDYAICSAPETMPFGAGLEPAVTAGIADQIWAINLQTGQTALVARPENVTAIGNLMFSTESPDDLFVTGRYDSKIYKINLAP